MENRCHTSLLLLPKAQTRRDTMCGVSAILVCRPYSASPASPRPRWWEPMRRDINAYEGRRRNTLIAFTARRPKCHHSRHRPTRVSLLSSACQSLDRQHTLFHIDGCLGGMLTLATARTGCCRYCCMPRWKGFPMQGPRHGEQSF